MSRPSAICQPPPSTTEDGVCVSGDLATDLGQMQRQRFGIGLGQDEGGGCGPRRADGAEDIDPICSADHAGRAVGFRDWPRPASTFPAGRRGLRSGTRPRSACHMPRAVWPPPPDRRSFFESLLGDVVSIRVTRPHRQAHEAELGQLRAHRTLLHDDPEHLLVPALQVLAPPPHHTVPLRIGTLFNQGGQFGLLHRRHPRLAAGGLRLASPLSASAW